MFLQLLSICAGALGIGATIATGCNKKIVVGIGVGLASGIGVWQTGSYLAAKRGYLRSKSAALEAVASWLVIPVWLILIILLANIAGSLANKFFK